MGVRAWRAGLLLLVGCESGLPATQPDAALELIDSAWPPEAVDLGSPPATCSDLPRPEANELWTLQLDGYPRLFWVHVPPSYTSSEPMPLIVSLHGYFNTAETQADMSGLRDKADRAGFITVHPEGLGIPQSWNAGDCCAYASTVHVDDVKFLRQMIAKLREKLCIDPKRIYATGFSNGAMMSFRLGCEAGDLFAAIAPVAGLLRQEPCTPQRAMPTIAFNGTGDPFVIYGGTPAMGWQSVPDNFAGWAAKQGCLGQPVETFHNGEATCMTYDKCLDGAEVTECTVENQGHAWPGGAWVPTQYVSDDISATDAMWDFFVAHPMP